MSEQEQGPETALKPQIEVLRAYNLWPVAGGAFSIMLDI